jgi:hypothetical protein
MTAMFSLLFRFCPRNSAGTPKVAAPAASEAVLMKLRRVNDNGFFLCGLILKVLTVLVRMKKKIITFPETFFAGNVLQPASSETLV